MRIMTSMKKLLGFLLFVAVLFVAQPAYAHGRKPPEPLPTQAQGCNGVGNPHCKPAPILHPRPVDPIDPADPPSQSEGYTHKNKPTPTIDPSPTATDTPIPTLIDPVAATLSAPPSTVCDPSGPDYGFAAWLFFVLGLAGIILARISWTHLRYYHVQ